MKFIKPEWPAPKNIKAYTTLRSGWGQLKKKPGDFHTASSQESQDLINLLNLPQEPIWIKQTHGVNIVNAIPAHLEEEADASYADHVNQICVVLTADCLPLLICNQSGTQVAAIHAGWRGLAAGIIEATINKLKQQGGPLLAWLGPAIGPSKFEVGKEVLDAFTVNDPDLISAFKSLNADKYLANLYTLATIKLKKMGVSQIYGGNFCTYTEENLFYSYRRDNKNTGRMASLIWIASK